MTKSKSVVAFSAMSASAARQTGTALLVALCLTAGALSGAAMADQPRSVFGGDIQASALGHAELGELRGGFIVAGDLLIDFGGIVRAYSNDTLFYENVFRLNSDGSLDSNPTLHQSGGQDWQLADQAILSEGLEAVAATGGVVLNQNGQYTALLHNAGRGQLGGYAFNTIPGIDVRHEIQVDIGVNNFLDIADQAMIAQQVRHITEGAFRAGLNAAR